MFNGAHIILYSTDAEADRAFLRDLLKLPHVDSGDGWLIFALPPAELAVHPAEANERQEFFFMCTDIDVFVRQMEEMKVTSEPVKDLAWGRLTYVTLPGGRKVGVYEPRHARPAG